VTVLRENRLEIHLPVEATGRRFDGENHGLSHCMKAVDFIVEMPDRIYYIEIKDPDQTANVERRQQFSDELSSGKIDEELKTKFRDTWIYEWAERRVTRKPVYYLILIAFEKLTAAELSTRRSGVERKLPVLGPSKKNWQRPFVRGCAVLNVAAWNRTFANMPIRRI
jgi:hypothetical protein